jgi:hypothetical protein
LPILLEAALLVKRGGAESFLRLFELLSLP